MLDDLIQINTNLSRIANTKTHYYINQQVYFILNNKIRKGKIVKKIDNESYYVSRFLFRHRVFPGFNCFCTKELAAYVLQLQLTKLSLENHEYIRASRVNQQYQQDY